MNSGDLNKVWEIKALKRKPNEPEARKILERIAKQVQPIMRKHNWRVKVLSEFCPKNPALLGVNVGRGIHVKLRLRRANRDDEFIPFDQVLDTMLHELSHNAHGPHNATFYKLWDELRKECEDLMSKGISGSGSGFDLPGKRLGGASRKPLSALRQTALKAAENRARLGSLMPSGPKKIGGDSSIMSSLTPREAAAMAAERRLQDNIWCGSEFYDLTEEDDESADKVSCSVISSTPFPQDGIKLQSRKRSRELDGASLHQSAREKHESNVIDLTTPVPKPKPTSAFNSDEPTCSNNLKQTLDGASSSKSSHDLAYDDQGSEWECTVCTLLNPPLAPICELCTTQRPKGNIPKSTTWSCRFCTLENDVKIDKCVACDAWRYSYGVPIAASAPNSGT